MKARRSSVPPSSSFFCHITSQSNEYKGTGEGKRVKLNAQTMRSPLMNQIAIRSDPKYPCTLQYVHRLSQLNKNDMVAPLLWFPLLCIFLPFTHLLTLSHSFACFTVVLMVSGDGHGLEDIRQILQTILICLGSTILMHFKWLRVFCLVDSFRPEVLLCSCLFTMSSCFYILVLCLRLQHAPQQQQLIDDGRGIDPRCGCGKTRNYEEVGYQHLQGI